MAFLCVASYAIPVSASTAANVFSISANSGSVAVEAASETKTTKIDFSTMKNLDNLPDNWKIQNGSGNSQLVDDSENGKVLKLSKTNSGNEISLKNSKLDINENEYRYVSIETKIKMGSETHANQFSIPYIKDSKGNTAYTLYADGNWSSYKSHVNGKNTLEAGKISVDKWQDIRMDIDLKKDTFRVTIDGECELAGVNARAKTDNLSEISFYADSWNTGTIYIDSVEVTAEKERTQSATFYVSNNGDDSKAGTSPETAWKSLDKVNSQHFIAGDKILFECGGEWKNQTLLPQGSGDENSKITIGSYGSGNLPKISTNGKMKDALYLCNQQYWDISNLD